MRDTKSKLGSDPRDGTLRIHRRRAGAYQPKDSLGLSCILQVNDPEESQLSTRRRTLTAPRDNIGISCLPTKDSRDKIEVLESDAIENGKSSSRENTIRKAEECSQSDKDAKTNSTLTSTAEILKKSDPLLKKGTLKRNSKESMNACRNELTKTMSDIGISNIQRPKDKKMMIRKPIQPKDNIGSSCQLLKKPSISRTNFRLSENRAVIKADAEKVLKTQSATNLKGQKIKDAPVTKRNKEIIMKNERRSK